MIFDQKSNRNGSSLSLGFGHGPPHRGDPRLPKDSPSSLPSPSHELAPQPRALETGGSENAWIPVDRPWSVGAISPQPRSEHPPHLQLPEPPPPSRPSILLVGHAHPERIRSKPTGSSSTGEGGKS